MPATLHTTSDTCPRCECTFLAHVHCASGACAYHLTVCPKCDDARAIVVQMRDHAKDHEPARYVELASAA